MVLILRKVTDTNTGGKKKKCSEVLNATKTIFILDSTLIPPVQQPFSPLSVSSSFGTPPASLPGCAGVGSEGLATQGHRLSSGFRISPFALTLDVSDPLLSVAR